VELIEQLGINRVGAIGNLIILDTKIPLGRQQYESELPLISVWMATR